MSAAPLGWRPPLGLPWRARNTEQLIYTGRAAGWLTVPALEPGGAIADSDHPNTPPGSA